jgi:beta-galactosidase/beta-glucuronidase
MHVGGFLPFSFDVTEQLVEGSNEIKIRVDSPIDDPMVSPEAPLAEMPLGKQSWYGPLSGIWQSVWLERRTFDHIERARVMPELATGRVGVSVFLANPLIAETRVSLAIKAPNGKTAACTSAVLERGAEKTELALTLAEIEAWSPAAPNLYTLHLTLERDGHVVDEFEDQFGFRTIEARNGHFYLNGEPLYIRAALDQDYYPDTICTTPSIEFLEDEFRKAKELGLNCLRCHIKAPDPRYYEVADRIGLLAWTELPTMGTSTERSRARKRATLRGIVDRDGNHPSIICWTIINENWGVDLVNDPLDRGWLKETYQWLKSYDPGRLVVDNSPLAPSSHVETDIADYHYYAAFPDNRLGWDRFVKQLASRASWLFVSGSEAVQTGHEPLMCSEFGNWGLPDPERLADASGNEPWWFETGHDWGEGVMYPHGVQHRFADWSLARVFGDLKGFVEAAQWQQFRALKYEIEALRRKKTLLAMSSPS